MLTLSGHNAPMRRKRSKGLWFVAALLAVNATLLVAQPGLALPGSLGNYFFGPKLVRAEVLVKDGGVLHDYRVDRGTIRNKAGGTLTLLERDGTLVPIPVAAGSRDHDRRQAGRVRRAPARYGRDRDSRRRRSGERGPRHSQMTATGAAELHPAGTPGPQLLLVEDEESIGSLVAPISSRAATASPGCAPARRRSDRSSSCARGSSSSTSACPGPDGFDVCRGIRARSDVPVADADRARRGGRPRRRPRGRRRRLRLEAVLAPRAGGACEGRAPAHEPDRARRSCSSSATSRSIRRPARCASPARPSS